MLKRRNAPQMSIYYIILYHDMVCNTFQHHLRKSMNQLSRFKSNTKFIPSITACMIILSIILSVYDHQEFLARAQTQEQTIISTNKQQTTNTDNSSTITSMLGNKLNNLLSGNVKNIIGTNLSDTLEKNIGRLTNSSLINKSLSGKIATSQIDLTNGNVEKVFFGSWALNASSMKNTEFVASFAVRGSSENKATIQPMSFSINNLRTNSFQTVNEDLVLKGLADVSSKTANTNNPAKSWNDVPITLTISAQNKILIIAFERLSPVNEIFYNTPLIGIVTASNPLTAR